MALVITLRIYLAVFPWPHWKLIPFTSTHIETDTAEKSEFPHIFQQTHTHTNNSQINSTKARSQIFTNTEFSRLPFVSSFPSGRSEKRSVVGISRAGMKRKSDWRRPFVWRQVLLTTVRRFRTAKDRVVSGNQHLPVDTSGSQPSKKTYRFFHNLSFLYT